VSKDDKNSAARQRILDKYLRLTKTKRMLPSRSDLISAGISRDQIRSHFGNITKLKEYAKESLPALGSMILDQDSFTAAAYRKLKKDIKQYKNLVITTAVVGKSVHEGFYQSLQLLCKKRKAKLLVLPCADPGGSKDWTMDSLIPKDCVVFDDIKINSNFSLCSIKTSAKQIQPLTGLEGIAGTEGSRVFASPKQNLEFVATSGEKMPHAIMTTGALTEPDYFTQRYMSERTAYIANKAHVMGAVIIEVKDNDIYHFTQIQAEFDTGYFADRGLYYMGDKKKVERIYGPKKGQSECGVYVEAIKPGDWHTGDTDPAVADAVFEAVQLFQPKWLFLDDFFNGHSINHHEEKDIIKSVQKMQRRRLDLSDELKDNADELNMIDKKVNKYVESIVMPVSNHNDWLSLYLRKEDLRKHPHNYKDAIKMQIAMIERGEDPLKCGMEMYGLKTKTPVRWLTPNEDLKTKAGVNLAPHGHIGKNGKRNPNKKGLLGAFGHCMVGHSHTPGIYLGVWQVGTSTYRRVGYNDGGASSWMQTFGIVYSNGSRQLINVINGEWPKP